MADVHSHLYNDPAGGVESSIGPQLIKHYHQRKALIDLVKEQYFTPLASVVDMPKNMGKKIVRYHYLPLLDDRNVNDQGINAAGVKIDNGNLYGSSKDIGTITDKLPLVGETGGRVNRVGFKRQTLEGSFAKYGFFTEYTKESLDFDSDSELWSHINREMLRGANEITEDTLQIDLINAAGTKFFLGAATSTGTVDETELTYKDFVDLDITLTNNRTPKNTKIITGSRMIDTKTIGSARVMYIGSELIPTLLALKDMHGNPAFIPVEKYGAAGTLLNGEIGTIYSFRIVVVPEMTKWAGAGADTTSDEHFSTDGKLDVFPMLVVGDGSFTTIGFQSGGKGNKFEIIHKKPGETTADRNDPFGETGFMSIKWFYGFMAIRPERIALIQVAAKQ